MRQLHCKINVYKRVMQIRIGYILQNYCIYCRIILISNNNYTKIPIILLANNLKNKRETTGMKK